jgi:META domain
MKSALAALALLLSHHLGLAMADKEAFVGKWKLVEAFDEEFQPFSLPEGDFVMELRDDDSCRGVDFLAASITIGNVMGTQIEFGASTADGDSITIERIMSTRMMPPEHLFRLETYLSSTMPKMTTVKTEVKDAETWMTMSGLGRISFTKV